MVSISKGKKIEFTFLPSNQQLSTNCQSIVTNDLPDDNRLSKISKISNRIEKFSTNFWPGH